MGDILGFMKVHTDVGVRREKFHYTPEFSYFFTNISNVYKMSKLPSILNKVK